jgi:hypothetical protein
MIENGDIWDLELKSLLSRIDNLNRLVPKDFCHKGPCAASDDFWCWMPREGIERVIASTTNFLRWVSLGLKLGRS